jgi:aryl-alcohol dehydrogenase-like predicted oxidoreductase
MNLTKTAYGTWSGGKYMHFGEALEDARFLAAIQLAYESGIRTFVTADVYGNGRADELLGQALAGIPRDSYSLAVGLGHDFYEGIRNGSAGYPRFTDPTLRGPEKYAEFLTSAAEKSLARCGTDHFDLVMLHNPDEIGYTSEAVWKAMAGLKSAGLTKQLGIAPGPANGFTLDMVKCFEEFCELIDWAMIILNPLEPWPGQLVLPAADRFGVNVLTRVVDYGGVFWDDVKAGHGFKPGDHRTYRPQGWVEHANEKADKMRGIAKKYNLSMIQFASLWNLAQAPVESVVPTFIQEAGEGARSIEEKIKELAALPAVNPLTPEDIEAVRVIGDNTGCMALKGASKRHEISTRPDEWAMREDLVGVAQRWELGSEW